MKSGEYYLQAELYKLIQEDSTIFQFIEEASLDGIWYWDLENPENEWMSPKFWTTLGYDPEKMPHSPEAWQNILFPEDAKSAIDQFHRHLADPEVPYDQIVRYRHKDGSTVWIRCRGVAIRDEQGKPIRMLGAHNDLTEGKLAEAKLQENLQELDDSRQELLSFLEEANDMIQIIDQEGYFSYVNPAWLRVLGYQAEEVKDLRLIDVIDPETRTQCMAKFDSIIRSQQPCNIQVRFISKAGELVIAEGNISVHKKKDGSLMIRGIYRDITEKLAIEEELRRTKEVLEQTSEVALVGGWETDLKTQKSHWTLMTRQILEVDDNFVPDTENWVYFYKEGESRKKIMDAVDLLITTGTPYDEEVLAISQTGRELWLRVQGRAVFEGDQCVRIFGTIQDIDKNKRIELRLKKQREKILKLSRQVNGVLFQYAIDRRKNHSFPFVSESVELLFGISVHEVYEHPDKIFETIHADDLPLMYEAIQKSYEELTIFQFDTRITTQSGETKWVSVNSKPERLASGTVLWNGYIEDISWRKEIEENLTKAKIAAEQASIAKSEFLANMSHEIRTPLNSVIGFTDLLIKTKLDKNQREYMHAVHHSGNALLDLINDILDFSKIEAGKLELSIEKTDLWEMVQQVSEIMKQKAAGKGINLILHISSALPRFAWIDPVRVRQVLVNLLGNAIKFTSEGEIEVSLTQLDKKNGQKSLVEFSVKDTGIGIHPDKQQQIFKAFSQEDSSTTRKYGGTGLGLSISNQLLGLMGSKLELESTPGVGSRFYFQMQLDTEDGESDTWKGLSDIRELLIIDTHMHDSMVIREMLSSEGVNCEFAINGLEGLEKVEKKSYDVIIVDYHMPFMNGMRVIHELRNTLQLSAEELPVILLHNANTNDEILADAERLQVSHVLSKPISEPTLFSALSQLNNVAATHILPDTRTLDLGDKNKVLIVDDNEVNLLLARTMIEKLAPQAEIMQVTDGLQAVEIFQEKQPNIILMDIQMPNLNGYDASKKIRKLSNMEHEAIIIALTAGTVKGERERCLAAGMNDYISKPIVYDDLAEMLSKWYKLIDYESVETKQTNQVDENTHFDLEALMKQIDHDEAIYQQLVTEFKLQLEQLLPLLDEAYQKKEIQLLGSLGHKLKGTAAVMHMVVLSQLTQSLEALAQGHISSEATDKLFNDLQKEITYLEDVLNLC